MNSANIIVQEYLGSLKEDKELDYLFPILLTSMGFKIVQTAKESKGQAQYGKDIIAIGKDAYGVKHRWYFELKGYSDRNINDKNYFGQDGIRESIIAAKDTVFNDSSILDFNKLPIKIVLVHNGVIKANLRVTLDGMVKREFPDGEFERWDIYHLTNLFSDYLFSEYLLSDDESLRLLKKTLAFLDTPDYDYNDFKKLVNLQFDKVAEVRGRSFTKLFATLNLLESIVFHYSTVGNNLTVAKECSKYLVLKTWKWILSKKVENKFAIKKEFDKLLSTQLRIFSAYFSKTFHIVTIQDGLYAENGAFFEKIGYPLRCFSYLDDMIYYSRLREHFGKSKNNKEVEKKIRHKFKDLMMNAISKNSGFYRPLLDNHSIPIVQLFVYFADESSRREEDVEFLVDYISKVLNNIAIMKVKSGFLPEFSNNYENLIETMALGKKTEEYNDESSMLVAVLLELVVIFKNKDLYNEIREYISKEISLQVPTIDFNSYDVEVLLFERNLHNEYHIEMLEENDGSFEEFSKICHGIEVITPKYRTDYVGVSFIRYLAHSYYKNELLPEEWRIYF